jgi:hypothetical protein
MAEMSARQRSLIATSKAVTAGTQAQAETEKKAREQPITGTATGYDPITGDWFVSTPDGGTIRAQSLTNGALIGRRLPIQRFGDSQTSSVNAPPTDPDQGWIVAEMELLQQDLFQLLGKDLSTGGVESPEPRHYTVILNNDARRRVDTLSIANFNADDTPGTNGSGVLKINGAVVTLGESVLELGSRLTIQITNIGTGSLFWSIALTRV